MEKNVGYCQQNFLQCWGCVQDGRVPNYITVPLVILINKSFQVSYIFLLVGFFLNLKLDTILRTSLMNKNVNGSQIHSSGINFDVIISQVKNALDWFNM